MASLNQLTFDILELVRGNSISDDIEIDERQIIYHINNQRALWLKREMEKPGAEIDQNIEQDLGCVELTTADSAECCDIESGCVLLRTKKKIPKTLKFGSSENNITRVGPVDKITTPFNFVPYGRAVYSGHGKYTKDLIYAYLLNDYIYIKTSDKIAQLMEYINVRGVFEDPTAVSAFIDCDNQSCFSLDDEYPIHTYIIPYIKEQILNQLGMAMKFPKDDSNDSNEILQKQ